MLTVHCWDLCGSYRLEKLHELPCRNSLIFGLQSCVCHCVHPLLRWFLLGLNRIEPLHSLRIKYDVFVSSHHLYDPDLRTELSNRDVLS